MKERIDIMFDLETLGLQPDCIFFQLGAVAFSRETFNIECVFDARISRENQVALRRTMDKETVDWWARDRSSKELYKTLTGGKNVLLVDALKSFSRFVDTFKPKGVWCHINFDWNIVKNAYDSLSMVFPFKYYSARDPRTIEDFFHVERNSALRNVGLNRSSAHDAVIDCCMQISYLRYASGIREKTDYSVSVLLAGSRKIFPVKSDKEDSSAGNSFLEG